MAKELLKRSQVKTEDTWAVEDLFATEEEFFNAVKQLEQKIEGFEEFARESAVQGGESLLAYYKQMEEAMILLDDTFAYAGRNGDVDMAAAHYQELRGKMTSVYNKFMEKTAPVETLIAKIEDNELEEMYEKVPELRKYQVSIADTRRLREHTLTPEMEILLASAKEMADGTEKAYDLLSDADFENPVVADEKGEMVKVSSGRFVPMLESPDVRVRRDTFQAYYARYEQYKNTFAALYEGKVKANCFFARARKYDSALEAAVNANNVPKEVYFNLIEAVHDNMDYLHQYVSLRKKLLKVEELRFYDIYVPIVSEMNTQIDYPQAQEEIKAALKVLGEDYVSVLEEGFTHRWIDKYENEGKVSGAYSAGNYSHHPYVLMNFQHNLDSEFTLAHEMGHALHSYYSAKHNNIMDSEYKIFVAEVASTCNEALLMDYLLKHTQDKKKRAYLINYFLEQFRTTLYRQTMFAEFEMLTHRMVEEGKSLTAENLKKVYYDLNVQYYGKEIVADEEIAIEWARIPHFYYNFYVYQYATSFAASMALSQKILKEGQPAVDKYLSFLSGGCTKAPTELLKDAGVDMTTKEPIHAALQIFGDLIKEMEELMK